MSIYLVQIGRWKKGTYKTKWIIRGDKLATVQAHMYYRGLNIGNGYKKRLVHNGKVLVREFS